MLSDLFAGDLRLISERIVITRPLKLSGLYFALEQHLLVIFRGIGLLKTASLICCMAVKAEIA